MTAQLQESYANLELKVWEDGRGNPPALPHSAWQYIAPRHSTSPGKSVEFFTRLSGSRGQVCFNAPP